MPARSGNKLSLTVTLPSDCEITMSRSFDAPRDLVFDAHTKPEHLVHWFGPRGHTLSVCTVDLRPGGAWRFVLREPNGREMGMKGVYREIVPPERLVHTEIFDDFEEMAGESIVTTIFEEIDGKTRVTSTSTYRSKEIRDAVIQSGMEYGAAETYERLAEYLATM
jgi:uncharacterized protein YndB with AHSA1/START domain